jgi:hypothetical protein
MRFDLAGTRVHAESIAPNIESVTDSNENKRGSGQVLWQNPECQYANKNSLHHMRAKQAGENLARFSDGKHKDPCGDLIGGPGEDARHRSRFAQRIYTFMGESARVSLSSAVRKARSSSLYNTGVRAAIGVA